MTHTWIKYAFCNQSDNDFENDCKIYVLNVGLLNVLTCLVVSVAIDIYEIRNGNRSMNSWSETIESGRPWTKGDPRKDFFWKWEFWSDFLQLCEYITDFTISFFQLFCFLNELNRNFLQPLNCPRSDFSILWKFGNDQQSCISSPSEFKSTMCILLTGRNGFSLWICRSAFR